MSERNLAISVRARLLNHARETQQDYNLVLTRYAIERLLYRLSISQYADQFLLKGALLFDLWFDIPHRPTRDADFLGLGSTELIDIEKIFKEICSLHAADGVNLHADSVKTSEIRKEANYAGVRITLMGLIDTARCFIQIDVGFGDAVTPGPENVNYPIILKGFDAPKLHVYPRYTVVAEKLHALSLLGMANSRMKDYFDLWTLAHYTNFDGQILRQAIQVTFSRRQTQLSAEVPFGLTDAFAQDAQKQTQWQAFIRKNKLEALAFNEVISALRGFLLPITEAATTEKPLPLYWPAGGPWLATNFNPLKN
jgi:hypothetical protein